jgi:hypothetical protein
MRSGISWAVAAVLVAITAATSGTAAKGTAHPRFGHGGGRYAHVQLVDTVKSVPAKKPTR